MENGSYLPMAEIIMVVASCPIAVRRSEFPVPMKQFPDPPENFPDNFPREIADLTHSDQGVSSSGVCRFWVHSGEFTVFSRLSGNFGWR
jgi:hypothetical protein